VTRRENGTPTAAKGHALVTGASSGIGTDLARQLAEKGYPLLLVARRKERLEALAAELTRKHQVDVVVLAVDLAEPTAAERLLAEVTQRGLRLEVLVNNAGYGMQGKFLTMAMPDVLRMVQLNVTTLTHLTQLAARAMVEAGHGYILNVASAAAFLPVLRDAALV